MTSAHDSPRLDAPTLHELYDRCAKSAAELHAWQNEYNPGPDPPVSSKSSPPDRRPYSKVMVLTLRWENHDLRWFDETAGEYTEHDIKLVKDAFKSYNYEVHSYAIPDYDPAGGVRAKLCQLLVESSNALIIIYYTGHGYLKSKITLSTGFRISTGNRSTASGLPRS